MVEVLDAAAALFAQRGFAATSLQDIAREIGLSRTSIYYYFPSKEALLGELVRGVTQNTETIFSELGAAGRTSHAAKLSEAARQLVMWVTDKHTHFRLLDHVESELPAELAAAHHRTKRRVLADMVALVEGGVAAGEFRAVDARIAAFAILGMCNWSAWWFSADGSRDRHAIADQIAGLAAASVQRASGSGARSDLPSLLASIREDLVSIERLKDG